MKVLLVSASFYPERSPRSFRATELARELARRGVDVSVLTLPSSEALVCFCKQANIKLRYTPSRKWGSLKLPGKLGSFVNRVLNRVALQAFEYPDVELFFSFSQALRSLISQFDLLISFAVPHPVHWATARVISGLSSPRPVWVADCGDPYMGNESDSFRKSFYFGWIERWAFRKADLITIPLEAAREAYYEEFHSKIRVIPQGVNFAELESKRVDYQPNQIPSFAYAGSFIPGRRDPRPFIQFLLGLKLDFRFFIFTSNAGLIESMCDKSNGRIVLRSYVPREELIAFLSSMDFLINVENTSITQAPSKLIDYHLAGRPVLSLRGDQQEFDGFLAFVAGNYEQQLRIENADAFRIENVASAFMATAKALTDDRG